MAGWLRWLQWLTFAGPHASDAAVWLTSTFSPAVAGTARGPTSGIDNEPFWRRLNANFPCRWPPPSGDGRPGAAGTLLRFALANGDAPVKRAPFRYMTARCGRPISTTRSPIAVRLVADGIAGAPLRCSDPALAGLVEQPARGNR